MAKTTSKTPIKNLSVTIGRFFGPVPLLGFLFSFLICVLLELAIGSKLSDGLGLPKMPVLFGLVTIFKVIAGVINMALKNADFDFATLMHIPMALVYIGIVYVGPVVIVTRLSASKANDLARFLQKWPLGFSATLHLGMMYAIFHFWVEPSDYRLIVLKLTLIAVLFTLSLNIINGYMGEFSCSHPGFMAIGAYMSSLFTVGLFVNDKVL